MDGYAELRTWPERPEYVDVDLFGFLGPDPRLVLQSHASKWLAQSTGRTRRYLYGLTG
jgi:hypothetical protein